MIKCKECDREFDDETSKLGATDLSKSSYDPKLLSDAKDLRFCSKWCEKKHEDRDYQASGASMQIHIGAGISARERSSLVKNLDDGRARS